MTNLEKIDVVRKSLFIRTAEREFDKQLLSLVKQLTSTLEIKEEQRELKEVLASYVYAQNSMDRIKTLELSIRKHNP
jgi:hypothetical protein